MTSFNCSISQAIRCILSQLFAHFPFAICMRQMQIHMQRQIQMQIEIQRRATERHYMATWDGKRQCAPYIKLYKRVLKKLHFRPSRDDEENPAWHPANTRKYLDTCVAVSLSVCACVCVRARHCLVSKWQEKAKREMKEQNIKKAANDDEAGAGQGMRGEGRRGTA